MTDVFAIFLYTGTFINGVKLAFITFRDNTFNIDNIEDSQIVYTIIGGLVIAWIAFYDITNKYKKLNA